MLRIDALKNKGIGKHCLIIGGGTSVTNFDFNNISDVDIISINDSIPEGMKVNYCMYNDTCFLSVYENKKIWEKCDEVICNASAYYKHCTYIYKDHELYPCLQDDDTGLKAILLAKNIMKYENIFLIGFDFYTKEINGVKVSHFHGDDVGKGKKYHSQTNLDNHIKRLSVFIERYEKIKNIEGVFNCNSESALKVFPFKQPWKIKVIA